VGPPAAQGLERNADYTGRSRRPRITHPDLNRASRMLDPSSWIDRTSRSVKVIGTSTTTNPLLMCARSGQSGQQ